LGVCGGSGADAQGTQASCEGVQKMALEGARIVSAERVGAGEFVPPRGGTPGLSGDERLAKKLPAFCRVKVVATPSADSAINIEVWLPEKGWEGKIWRAREGGVE